ncbi:hypothetical protein [uncultured Gammaproteobacteria bacterium]|uniref:type II toxin-antitoxin system RelE/ParE family toxin n=1 Tax=Bathymodiolus heckerae thiotrophic gill symbiont TaxID=1052212 RepID=UPI0010BC23CC|nr:hypothetical protein [uncultured Gammaproteobacteria bacterium]SHN91094.1 hypothetical protein BHECKSOX_1383 [Bathymodiolus heckerae thiotrophic gill symbiont]
MTIHYTLESVQDLDRLRKFIANKSLSATNRIVSELKQEVNKLCEFPSIGIKIVSMVNSSEIRDLFIGHYTVRFLVVNDDIFILRLWHDKENERNS